MLILNAGVFGLPHTITVDGVEAVFQVNYLSQAYLTLKLEDVLTRSAPARVVFVSSESHRYKHFFSTSVYLPFIHDLFPVYSSVAFDTS